MPRPRYAASLMEGEFTGEQFEEVARKIGLDPEDGKVLGHNGIKRYPLLRHNPFKGGWYLEREPIGKIVRLELDLAKINENELRKPSGRVSTALFVPCLLYAVDGRKRYRVSWMAVNRMDLQILEPLLEEFRSSHFDKSKAVRYLTLGTARVKTGNFVEMPKLISLDHLGYFKVPGFEHFFGRPTKSKNKRVDIVWFKPEAMAFFVGRVKLGNGITVRPESSKSLRGLYNGMQGIFFNVSVLGAVRIELASLFIPDRYYRDRLALALTRTLETVHLVSVPYKHGRSYLGRKGKIQFVVSGEGGYLSLGTGLGNYWRTRRPGNEPNDQLRPH